MAASPRERDQAMTDSHNGPVEVIPVKVDLREKAPPLPAFRAKVDPVAAAEAAVEKLSFQFKNWMVAEVEKLDAIWKLIRQDGLNDDRLDELYRTSHDIKGQAETFGYPLAGQAAASLCMLFEHIPDRAALPLPLLEKHVQAMMAIVNEQADEQHPIGRQLVTALKTVTDELVTGTGS